jgi:hypothetical protein
MKSLFGGILCLLAIPVLLVARPAEPVARFQLTLERTANGWAAQCDTGCAWAELSVSCDNRCRVLIDASGVTAPFSGSQTEAAFGFVVSRTGKGWQAESLAGTAWTKVGWGCLTGRCRARIDEVGVTTLGFGL